MADIVYQVFVQDEYDNNYLMGFYKDLNDSVSAINDFLASYGVSISEKDLRVRSGSFGKCFDKNLCDVFEGNDDVCGVSIRGFVLSEDDMIVK